jgi:RNA polymerase sigma-70 factor (ECF subfamily)
VHRDVRVDAAGWSGLRTALAAMTASAVPQPSTVPPHPAEPQHAADQAHTVISPSVIPQPVIPPSVIPQPEPGQAAGERSDSTRSDAAQAESLRMLEWVKLAQDGDGEAFGRLYDAYSDTVFRYVYYRVSNRQLAEDITSETFLRALRRIGTFTWQGRDFGAWLVTIARNLVADHFKSSRYRLEVPTGEMMDSNETECSPEDSVLSYLSNRALLDAVCRLNSQQQECVTLRFLHGLSVAETAKIMGKNDGAIKTLQYRAIRTLARLLPVDLR